MAEINSTPELPAIRPIQPRDATEVSELCSQLGYRRSPEQVREWIGHLGPQSRTQAAFVALLGLRVVGWIEVSVRHDLQSAPYGFIGGLVVQEGIRGGGIGKRLCERGEAWVREGGVVLMRVTSRSTRENAHRFYLRDGYRQIKTSLVFEKKLGN